MSLVSTQTAQSGLVAAAVASLFRDSPYPPLPCICEDLHFHWPSLILGILLGLLFGQVFEWLVLLRAVWTAHLRNQTFWLRNSVVARARLA